MWTVRNTYMDRTKSFQHRATPRLEMEPEIAGQRCRIRDSIQLSQQQVEINKVRLEALVKSGVIEVTDPAGQKLFQVGALPMTTAPAEPATPEPAPEPQADTGRVEEEAPVASPVEVSAAHEPEPAPASETPEGYEPPRGKKRR